LRRKNAPADPCVEREPLSKVRERIQASDTPDGLWPERWILESLNCLQHQVCAAREDPVRQRAQGVALPNREASLDNGLAAVNAWAEPLDGDPIRLFAVVELPEGRRLATLLAHVTVVVGEHALRCQVQQGRLNDSEASNQEEKVGSQVADRLKRFFTVWVFRLDN
jgi:hypothetical protein